jgi:predicted nicotinamide N-methyase
MNHADLLENLKGNLSMNACHGAVVRDFNFFESQHPIFAGINDAAELKVAENEFEWNRQDLEYMRGCEIIIAADVVYDDELTKSIVERIVQFLTILDVSVYIGIEKRINFTLEKLSVCAPAYDYFFEQIDTANAKLEASGKGKIMVDRIDISKLKFYFLNDMDTSCLELWRLVKM